MIGLGLTPETAEKFFMAIDVDGTGGVEVAELFRAGAFLRGGGAKKGATDPTSPVVRKASQPEVSTSAVKLTTEGSSAPAANGVVAVGVAPVPAKPPMGSADLQLKLEALKTKLKNRAQWWTQERWDPTYEMRSTLRYYGQAAWSTSSTCRRHRRQRASPSSPIASAGCHSLRATMRARRQPRASLPKGRTA